jgi:hypothetical protein
MALLVGFVSGATCYAGTRAASATAQMCCVEMAYGCGESHPSTNDMDSPHDCCAAPAANVTVAATTEAVLAPSADWVRIQPPEVLNAPDGSVAAAALRTASSPAYLLGSVFRI